MNPRQRIQAILNRQSVDRIPIDLWCTGEVLDALSKHFAVEGELALYRAMGLDKAVWINPTYLGPTRPPEHAGEFTNYWGVRLKAVQAGAAEYAEFVEHPLLGYETPESLADYPWWPDPEKFDYDQLAQYATEVSQEFATLGPWISLFEIYCYLRGLEQAMMDILINPELVHAILARVEAIQTEMMKRLFERCAPAIDMTFISDDMGNQKNLMFSIETWATFLKPGLKRWCDLIHSYGIKVFYHSDGAVEPLIPHLIDCGVDVLNPIQHACPGMELESLKAKYGDRLIFHGGVDNQTVLPFGTPEAVRAETRQCLETLGQGGGGYICCSCHNVQAGTPVENVLAMVETALGR